jgi:hypothetical protein
MRKEATLNDLKNLVDKLVLEGFGHAQLGFNDEYAVYLEPDGTIDYDIYHNSKQGITYIDIHP